MSVVTASAFARSQFVRSDGDDLDRRAVRPQSHLEPSQDLLSASLSAGFPWMTATLPFPPNAVFIHWPMTVPSWKSGRLKNVETLPLSAFERRPINGDGLVGFHDHRAGCMRVIES